MMSNFQQWKKYIDIHKNNIYPSLIFAGKAGAYQSAALMGHHSNGKLLPLPANISLV